MVLCSAAVSIQDILEDLLLETTCNYECVINTCTSFLRIEKLGVVKS